MIRNLAIAAIALILSSGIVSYGYAHAQAPALPSCDPSYVGVCIPPKPPDLDCIQISERNIEVVGNDPHDLDRDSDGIGCESPTRAEAPSEPTPVLTPEAPSVNESVPIEPLPANETGEIEVPPVIPAENETQTPEPEPEPLPPTSNETVPIEGNVSVPVENQTTEPEPLPPVFNETVPVEGNVTVPAGNETASDNIPIEGNVTTLPATNASETGSENVTVTEPEPPTNGGGTETIPVEGNVTVPANATSTENATIDIERTEEQPLNATQVFDKVENASAILGEKISEVEGESANETERADIKAAIGESLGALGESSTLIVNATDDQLITIQDTATTVSDAIDVIRDEGE